MQLREILYHPTVEDMELYPTLLGNPPAEAPITHPQYKMQISAITTLYLSHRRSWSLMKPFIEAGGLLSLVSMLLHENLHLRGQVRQQRMSGGTEVVRQYGFPKVFTWYRYQWMFFKMK